VPTSEKKFRGMRKVCTSVFARPARATAAAPVIRRFADVNCFFDPQSGPSHRCGSDSCILHMGKHRRPRGVGLRR